MQDFAIDVLAMGTLSAACFLMAWVSRRLSERFPTKTATEQALNPERKDLFTHSLRYNSVTFTIVGCVALFIPLLKLVI